MNSSAILRLFAGVKCSACGGGKQKSTGFCGRCYHSLPEDLKNGLWRRFGSGFEEAFGAAAEWLAEKNKQRRLAL